MFNMEKGYRNKIIIIIIIILLLLLVCLSDGPPPTAVGAAALRQKLITPAASRSHSALTPGQSVLALTLELICDDNRKFPVMTGTLLFVLGSCERHSELTEEMGIPLVHVTVILN